MKTYLYVDYENLCKREINENQIIDQYWDIWKEMMEKKYNLNHYLITPMLCIEDWVMINLAYPVPISTSPHTWYEW